MKMINIDDVWTMAIEPRQALRDTDIRYTHYMRNFLDTPEEFLVGYSKTCLMFSKSLPDDVILKYENMFKKFAKAKVLDSRLQNTRIEAIKKKFGKQGETAAIKLFNACHGISNTKRTQKEKTSLFFYLSGEDREKLLALREMSKMNGLSENQFARLLLQKELKRLLPDVPAHGELIQP